MRPIRQLICAPGRIRPIIGLELGTTSFRALAARQPVVAHEAANIAIAPANDRIDPNRPPVDIGPAPYFGLPPDMVDNADPAIESFKRKLLS